MASLSGPGVSAQVLLKPDQHVIPKPSDIMNFSIRVLSYHMNSTTTVLIDSSKECIRCEKFFQNGQEFFGTIISHPYISTHISSQDLDEVIDEVMCMVKKLLHFDEKTLAITSNNPSDSQQPQEFSFSVEITLYVEGEDAAEEGIGNSNESEEDATTAEEIGDSDEFGDDDDVDTMIPASNEAIQTLLKKSNLMKQDERCAICLEEFCNNGDEDEDCIKKGYAMPCNHLFHKRCIVSWLQTSHMCPLCRYPLPMNDS